MALVRQRLRVRFAQAQPWIYQHPLLFVTIVATVPRVVFAVVSFVLNGGVLIHDETQYLTLANHVATGHTADSWYPFYGQALYNSTWAFVAPLVQLVKVFGPHRIVGQLLAVGFGVAVVVCTSWMVLLARGSKRMAIVAGVVAALLPSQVLWSSVVLRESEIWLAVVLIGVGLAASATRRGVRALVPLLACVVGLCMLAHLRDQTMIAAGWAMGLTLLFLPSPTRLLRAAVGLGIVLWLPVQLGLGWGGWYLVQRAAPSLGATRTKLAQEAKSAFTPTSLFETTTTVVATGGRVTTTTARPAGGGGGGGVHRTTTTTTTAPPPTIPPGYEIFKYEEHTYLVDETVSGHVQQLPRGLVAMTLRPFPWDAATSVDVRLAQIENFVWFVLYGFAVIGFWVRRRWTALLAYPFFVSGMVVGIAAVTEGNLGTAFRHRGQILWAVAVAAAVGGDWVVNRRSGEAAPSAAVGLDPADACEPVAVKWLTVVQEPARDR